MKASKMYRAYLLLAIMLMSAIYSQSIHAVGLASPIPGPYMPSFYWKHGAVFTRALALDNGYPQYVEIDNATGAEVGYIGSLASPEWQEAWQTSADTFHAYQARYDHHMTPSQQNADLPKLMSVEEYNQTDFVTIDDKPVNKQAIGAPYTHVLVVNEKRIFSTSGEFLIVDKYQLDPSQIIAGNSKSLLINPKGQVIFQSPNNIGFRVGFYGDPGEPMIEANKRPGRESGDKIFGPLAGVPLQMGFTGGGVTDEEGKYTFTYLLPPCPGFSFHYTTTFWATMYYQRFNPYHDGIMPYVMMRDDYDFCMGYEVYDYRVIPIKASISTYKPAIDFPVDLIVLNGFASITEDGKNVPIAEPTRFVSYKETGDKQLYRIARQKRDFDGDGQLDTVLLGSIEYIPADDPTQPDIPVFNPAGEDIQGVWLSAADLDAETQAQLNSAHAIQQQLFELRQQGEDDPDLVAQLAELDVIKVEPDFSRQADWSDNFDDFGKLEQISKEDLLKTDIYVVRSSNGELVYEREGIPEDELDSGIKDGRFNYTVKLRGGLATELSYKTYQDFSQWQIDGHIQPKFQQRQADHLRAGELVEVYAINRVTGYMGVMPVRLKAATGGSLLLSFPIDELKMTRPNLKVWSTRKTRQELGLNQGQIDEYLIGNEGAGLTQDMFLALYTEWTNQDGSPIPAVLGDFGYTARLASLVDDQVLGEYNASSDSQFFYSSSSVSQFSVLPGIQLQALMLFRDNVDNQRFYVQVHAKPEAESPDFSSTGRHQGKTGQRPDEFVPFKVPVFDEDATSAIQDNLNAQKSANPDFEWQKADPIYHYVYRPEYQFSQYTLQIDEVNRKSHDGELINLKYESVPVITTTDELLDLLYVIAIDENLPLDAWAIDGQQELIFNVGGTELVANVNQGTQTVSFDNLEVIQNLNVEDVLSIRLYANNDSANILWEYAYWTLHSDVAEDDVLQGEQTYYVNADSPSIDLTANLVGFTLFSDEVQASAPERIHWKITSGNGYLTSPSALIDEDGFAKTTLKLTPSVKNVVHVEAYLAGAEKSTTKPIIVGVIPGKPSTINIQQSGSAYLKAVGEVELDVTVKDKSGNFVLDGTGVHIEEYGHINVKSSTGLTDKGKIKATITGGSIAGAYQVDALSGTAKASTSVTISSLDVNIDGLPDQLIAGKEYDLIAKVTGGNGSLANLFLDIGVSGGVITNRETATDNKGELKFSYRAANVVGEYSLGIKLDLAVPVTFPVQVIAPTSIQNDSYKLQKDYLVAGADSTSTELVRYSGEQVSINFPESIELSVTGAEGDNWSVALNDPHLPNREPIYFSRYKDLAWDVSKRYSSRSQQVFRLPTGFAGIFAISPWQEVTDSPWMLWQSNDFIVNNPSYNFWLNLQQSGEVINIANGSIKLVYQDGTLTATAQAKDGSNATIATSVSVSGINPNQWYAVAIRILEGELTLFVDNNSASKPLANSEPYYKPLAAEEAWLRLAKEFKGKIAGLRIYDLGSPALLSFSQESGALAKEGEANTRVELTAYGKQRIMSLPSVTIGLSQGNGQHNTINVLSKEAVSKMSYVMHSAQARSNLSVDDVILAMPLDKYFPDPKNGAASYVSGFAVAPHAESANSNILANLAWMKLNNKYPVLHNDIEVLQTYFANQNATDLNYYSIEFLQQAIVEESLGNNFWLRSMITGLKVWAELIESHPEQAAQIANSIQSRMDFWTWIRVLSLPANGWATDTIPLPRPDMTCDKVSGAVNIGTPLEYGAEPCRATGSQIAALIQSINIIDPDTLTTPSLLTVYFSYTMSATKTLPLEYKKWFRDDQVTAYQSDGLFPQAHAAGPLAIVGYAFRAMVIALKQTIKTASGGAPANFVAFLQEGTTSRVDAKELLPAIAYLSSRLKDAPDELCNGCKKLNEQVSETVKQDIATWFVGMGFARKGVVSDDDFKDQSCTIGFNTHGKAFEILGTAMYHALFEFGDKLSLPNASKYEILLSDPRKDPHVIKVGLMTKRENSNRYRDYDEIQRKPDLILAGEGEGKRTWVEFKSWKYNSPSQSPAYLEGNDLNPRVFIYWNGQSSSTSLGYTANANRQHFLDFAASQSALQTEYWNEDGEDFKEFKPSKHYTWVQVWQDGEQGKRSWRALKKDNNNKFYLERTPTVRHRATSWIGTDGLITTVPIQFQALQRFLTGIGGNMDARMYETSIGYDKNKHNDNYRDKQVASNFTGLIASSVRPFNVPTFLAIELGQQSQELIADAKSEIVQAIGGGDWADLQAMIDKGDITEAQITQMREKIDDEIDKLLGPLQYLIFDIPFLSDLEDKAAELVISDELAEKIQNGAAEIDLPESFLENSCEK